MQLNKFIAQSGVCSRRKAQELIKSGQIKVNDQIVTNSAFRVKTTDKVKYKNKILSIESKVYIILNKPKGYITTTSDEKNRKTVLDLLDKNCKKRLFPIGRLDKDTTGLLLITNDGILAQILAHPKYEISKVYSVTISKPITIDDFNKIKSGLKLKDGFIKPDFIEFLDKNQTKLKVKIHSGKNRIVRRMFESLGYSIKKLDRISYAGITKKQLKLGQWRILTKSEIEKLYNKK